VDGPGGSAFLVKADGVYAADSVREISIHMLASNRSPGFSKINSLSARRNEFGNAVHGSMQ